MCKQVAMLTWSSEWPGGQASANLERPGRLAMVLNLMCTVLLQYCCSTGRSNVQQVVVLVMLVMLVVLVVLVLGLVLMLVLVLVRVQYLLWYSSAAGPQVLGLIQG
jgi:CDP-diglyceride synthetase